MGSEDIFEQFDALAREMGISSLAGMARREEFLEFAEDAASAVKVVLALSDAA